MYIKYSYRNRHYTYILYTYSMVYGTIEVKIKIKIVILLIGMRKLYWQVMQHKSWAPKNVRPLIIKKLLVSQKKKTKKQFIIKSYNYFRT